MPQPTSKFLGLLGFVLTFLALPLLSACSSDGAQAVDDGDADVAPPNVVDGSASADAGPDVLPAMPSPEMEGLWLGSARGAESNADSLLGDATSCFDGVDNDADDNDTDDGVDCNDPECQTLPSCCANDASCVTPSSTSVVNQDFEGCADAICGENFTIFGGPSEPVIDDGTLALQGDSFYDTGLYGGEVLNLRHQRIDLEVEFRLGECAGCVESAAVALTAQAVPGDSTFIRPLVGLRGLATVNEVQLIIHDRVVATYPAENAITWTLSVRPDGQVTLGHDGVMIHQQFVPVAEAHLVVYGHSTNPGVDRVGARIDRLKVDRYTTDRVDAWTTARSLNEAGGHVSATRFNGVDYLAVDGGGTDNVVFRLASDGSQLNWLFDDSWIAHDYTVAQIDGAVFVYAINADGNLVRGAVDLVASEVGDPEMVLDPMSLGWGAIGHPVILQAADVQIVVVEVDGALDAAFFNGTDWAIIGALPSFTAGAHEPSLVAHNDVYWLHYSVQNGTRQRVRAMVSDQMVHWRDLGDALTGSGVRDSVDRFSVASPSVISDGETLRMYLSADDHVLRRIAVVERLSPAGRSR